jgi:hypothetical protein
VPLDPRCQQVGWPCLDRPLAAPLLHAGSPRSAMSMGPASERPGRAIGRGYPSRSAPYLPPVLAQWGWRGSPRWVTGGPGLGSCCR